MGKITQIGFKRLESIHIIEKVVVLWMVVNGALMFTFGLFLCDRFTEMTQTQIKWFIIGWNALCLVILAILLIQLKNLPRKFRIVREGPIFFVERKGLWWRKSDKTGYSNEELAREELVSQMDYWNEELESFTFKKNYTLKVVEERYGI